MLRQDIYQKVGMNESRARRRKRETGTLAMTFQSPTNGLPNNSVRDEEKGGRKISVR
jgi:hypothetical protein